MSGRLSLWFVDSPCECPYEYGNGQSPHNVWPDWMKAIAKDAEFYFKPPKTFNAVNLNIYFDGHQGLEWLADDEIF